MPVAEKKPEASKSFIPYEPAPGEEYMNEKQLAHFRQQVRAHALHRPPDASGARLAGCALLLVSVVGGARVEAAAYRSGAGVGARVGVHVSTS